MQLNLSECSWRGKDKAIKAFEDGDAIAFICSVENGAQLAFVFDNAYQLKQRGIYEPALLHGYISGKGNYSNWTMPVLQMMFDFADREKLLAAGDSLPTGDTFTVYRGVTGKGCKRRVRGFSWTLDYDKAEWFAQRYDFLGDPAVFKATVNRVDVLAYSNDRHEQEIICRPRSAKRIKSLVLAA